jgi:hypothetical protein
VVLVLLSVSHFNENRTIQNALSDKTKYESQDGSYNVDNTFEQGVFYLCEQDWVQARQCFSKLAYSGDHFHANYSMNLSLLGLTEVLLLKSNGGLYRCYDALKEAPDNMDLYFHIAYAEYLLGHRRRCIRALKNCNDHVLAKKLMLCIGARKKIRKPKISIVQQMMKKLFRKNSDLKIKAECMKILNEYLAIKLDKDIYFCIE